ncbi:hypothetical protein J6590_028354 [Homalodisca vitripennis]|nr:hypothetical protein J6590_028354 [Homalodisca vitripennis]
MDSVDAMLRSIVQRNDCLRPGSEKQFCVSGNAFVRAVAGSHINDSGGGAYEDKKKTRGAKKEGQIGDVSHKQLNAKSLQTSVHGPQRDCGAVISGGACQTIQINVAIHSLPPSYFPPSYIAHCGAAPIPHPHLASHPAAQTFGNNCSHEGLLTGCGGLWTPSVGRDYLWVNPSGKQQTHKTTETARTPRYVAELITYDYQSL